MGGGFCGALWTCIKPAAADENRAGVLPGQEKTRSAPDGHIAIEALQLAEALAHTAGQGGLCDERGRGHSGRAHGSGVPLWIGDGFEHPGLKVAHAWRVCGAQQGELYSLERVKQIGQRVQLEFDSVLAIAQHAFDDLKCSVIQLVQLILGKGEQRHVQASMGRAKGG